MIEPEAIHSFSSNFGISALNRLMPYIHWTVSSNGHLPKRTESGSLIILSINFKIKSINCFANFQFPFLYRHHSYF